MNPDQADSDSDGIGDVCDNYNDADGDDVTDGEDYCPGTPSGETVDANGCAIIQLCVCDNNWKNHGAYLKCVAHAAEDFVEASLLTDVEKDGVVSEAAQSTCGQKTK